MSVQGALPDGAASCRQPASQPLPRASIHIRPGLQNQHLIAHHGPLDVLVHSAQCLLGLGTDPGKPRDQRIGQHLTGAGDGHFADTGG